MTTSDEDLAAAIAVQDQQRRLGVRVASVEEILGLVAPTKRTAAGSGRQISKGLPSQTGRVYSAPKASQVIPFISDAKSLGSVMRSNFTVSHEALAVIRDRLKAEGCTPARAALVTQVFLEAAGSLPVESAKAALSAADIAERIGLGKSAIGEALNTLEAAGVIARTKDGRARPIWISPKFVYRGRSAMFAGVLAEFDGIAGQTKGT